MAEKDFMDTAVEEFLGIGNDVNPPVVEPPKVEPELTPPVVETPPPVADPVTPPVNVWNNTPEEVLREFNKLTGLNFDNIDKAKDFASKVNKLPELQQQTELLPELINALESVQNPMNYFRDETAYKVAMLSKDKKYQGKESLIDEILRGDLNALDDVAVISLASSLKARQGVRNPLRAELRGMNIDPDDVIENYATLDDDTKDLLRIRADQYREDLSQIGSDVKVPTFEGTNVEKLLSQKKAAKEDFDARLKNTIPIAENIIEEIKELKLGDDFSFKLDLTADQKKAYAEDLAELLVSGRFDTSTEDGKTQLYGTLLDMIKADHFDKAVAAMRSHLTAKIEEDMRRKYNNEVPLAKNEPPPTQQTDNRDWITVAAEKMVAERQ